MPSKREDSQSQGAPNGRRPHPYNQRSSVGSRASNTSNAQPARAPPTRTRSEFPNPVRNRGPPDALYNRRGKSQVGRQPSMLAPVNEMAQLDMQEARSHATANQNHTVQPKQNYASPSVVPHNAGKVYNVKPKTKTEQAQDWDKRKDVPEDQKNEDYVGEIVGFHVIRTGNTMKDFVLGMVIRVAYHEANTNPNNGPDDPNIANTCVGPAYSKSRMVIIIWIRMENLVALPLYTWHFRGLQSRVGKNRDTRNEYACMVNAGDAKAKNFHPKHKAIEFKATEGEDPLHETSCVHLSGLTKIPISQPFDLVGRISSSSYKYLLSQLEIMNKEAVNAASKSW